MNILYNESRESESHPGSSQENPIAGRQEPWSAPGEPAPMPDVFRYEDYRAFMKDRFAALQARDPSFSQRGLARRAGIANPGFFNEVIHGRRRLSPAAAMKMAVGLALTEHESEFFSVLVEFAESREARVKLSIGKRMVRMQHRHFFLASGDEAGPATGFQDIVRELSQEWYLQAAALEVRSGSDPAGEGEGRGPALVQASDHALRAILEDLIGIRKRAADPAQPGSGNASGPIVRIHLQAQPRSALPARTPIRGR